MAKNWKGLERKARRLARMGFVLGAVALLWLDGGPNFKDGAVEKIGTRGVPLNPDAFSYGGGPQEGLEGGERVDVEGGARERYAGEGPAPSVRVIHWAVCEGPRELDAPIGKAAGASVHPESEGATFKACPCGHIEKVRRIDNERCILDAARPVCRGNVLANEELQARERPGNSYAVGDGDFGADIGPKDALCVCEVIEPTPAEQLEACSCLQLGFRGLFEACWPVFEYRSGLGVGESCSAH